MRHAREAWNAMWWHETRVLHGRKYSDLKVRRTHIVRRGMHRVNHPWTVWMQSVDCLDHHPWTVWIIRGLSGCRRGMHRVNHPWTVWMQSVDCLDHHPWTVWIIRGLSGCRRRDAQSQSSMDCLDAIIRGLSGCNWDRGLRRQFKTRQERLQTFTKNQAGCFVGVMTLQSTYGSVLLVGVANTSSHANTLGTFKITFRYSDRSQRIQN